MSGLNNGQRLAVFALAVAVVFAMSIGVGRWVGPISSAAQDEHGHDDTPGEER